MKRKRKELNFMYAYGNVSHNYLACPLAPNMWFHIDSGFIDYISSDHGLDGFTHIRVVGFVDKQTCPLQEKEKGSTFIIKRLCHHLEMRQRNK